MTGLVLVGIMASVGVSLVGIIIGAFTIVCAMKELQKIKECEDIMNKEEC